MVMETPMVTEKMIRDAVEAVSDEIDWVQGLFGGSYDNAEQVMRFALKAALSTDADPVGYLVPRGDVAGPDNEYYSFCEDRGSAAAEADIYDKGYFPLYADPPAPSVAVKDLEWNLNDSWNVSRTVIGTYVARPCLATKFAGQWLLRRAQHEDSDKTLYASEDEAKAAAQADYKARILSALSAQVQDVAGTVEVFDRDHPELYWSVAKGKITEGEPLYGAMIMDLLGREISHGESDKSAVDAFNIAVANANLPAAPAAKLEEKP